MDGDVLLSQVYKVDTGDAASMRTGIVVAVDQFKGLIDVDVAGELLRDIPYAAGLAPIVGGTVWLIEQGSWFAAISAAASSGQYGGVDEVLVGGEPPTAVAVDLWMDTNEAGEGDGWAALDARYLKRDGDTSDGPLLVDMDPVDDMQVVPRRYAVARSGDQMTGMLESILPGVGGGGGAPNVRVVRAVAPEIHFNRSGASAANFHKWKQYVSGLGTSSAPTDSAMTFASISDDELTAYTAFRMFRDGRMLIGADPTEPLEVATKQYVDAFGPGGWLPLTPGSGLTGAARARVEGASGVVVGAYQGTIGASGATLATLPAGVRPVFPPGSGLTYYGFTCASPAGGAFTNVRVWANGAITVSASASSPTGVDLSTIRFPVA